MAGKMLVERTTSHREGNSARPEGEAPEKGENRAAQAAAPRGRDGAGATRGPRDNGAFPRRGHPVYCGVSEGAQSGARSSKAV